MDQERQVKQLKRILDGWRVAVIPLRSVFFWEEQWHPIALVATNLLLHLTLWALNLNFLTTLSVMGLFINFLDFIVPIICNTVNGPNSWNGQKEKIFEDTCKSIVTHYNTIMNSIKSFYALRENTPYLYYIICLSTLFGMAWLASEVDNFMISFFATTTALLWPGIQSKGAFNPIFSMMNKKKN